MFTVSRHVAPISGEQTNWLESVLKDWQERPHLIAVDHVPCYPSYRNPQGKDGKQGTGEEAPILVSAVREVQSRPGSGAP